MSLGAAHAIASWNAPSVDEKRSFSYTRRNAQKKKPDRDDGASRPGNCLRTSAI